MNTTNPLSAHIHRKTINLAIAMLIVAAALLLPSIGIAQNITETSKKVCGFFENINKLLNAASIIVVTIAVIFSGYQIAFAHKRITDVTPPLIGGVLIGAAAQLAKMVVGGNGDTKGCTATSGILIESIQAATHFLQFHA